MALIITPTTAKKIHVQGTQIELESVYNHGVPGIGGSTGGNGTTFVVTPTTGVWSTIPISGRTGGRGGNGGDGIVIITSW